VTRTFLFDQIIREQVAQGADMVVNLAAGLGTRPYRMQLPSSLRWIEVDLPEILTCKGGVAQAREARMQAGAGAGGLV
jgi:O-methyltransferase involved in polyketide biosynthesis